MTGQTRGYGYGELGGGYNVFKGDQEGGGGGGGEEGREGRVRPKG